MTAAFSIFGLFYFYFMLFFGGQVLGMNIGGEYQTPILLISGGSTILLVIYGLVVWTMSPYTVDKINDANAKIAKLRVPSAMLLIINYIVFCIVYHDYSFPFFASYLISGEMTIKLYVFFGIFGALGFFLGITIFSGHDFSGDEFVTITKEEVADSGNYVEVSRSAPYVSRGQFVLSSVLGVAVAALFILTPFGIVFALYFATRGLMKMLKKGEVKYPSLREAYKAQRRSRRLNILIATICTVSFTGPLLLTRGVHQLPARFERVAITNNNQTDYFSYRINNMEPSYIVDVAYASIGIEITTQNKNPHYYQDVDFSYKLHLQYVKVHYQTLEVVERVENQYDINSSLIIVPIKDNYRYIIESSNIIAVSGNYKLRHKLENMYRHILTKDNIRTEKIFDEHSHETNNLGISFVEDKYIYKMFFRFKNKSGQKIDITIKKTFMVDGYVYTDEALTDAYDTYELVLVNGYTAEIWQPR